jgi:acyl-CoA synthetase (NDP forming)
VIAVPAERSIDVVRDCARKGVRAIILISGGFSESRQNTALEREIKAIAQRHGIRVIGPNCLGIVYSGRPGQAGINTFFVPEEKFHLDLEKDNNVAFGAGAVYNRFGQILESGGVPTFLTANRAMLCLNAFIHYRLTRCGQHRDEWLT